MPVQREGLRPAQAALFWAKVSNVSSGCWEWTGARTPDGYGKVKLDGVVYRTHRVSYEEANGPIAEGMVICHKCDNPPCCNPDHLFASTSSHNNLETWAKKRRPRMAGEASPTAKLTAEQVEEIRESYEASDVSYQELADEYGVSQRAISKIVNRETWT